MIFSISLRKEDNTQDQQRISVDIYELIAYFKDIDEKNNSSAATMSTSVIKVQHRDGSPAKHVRVVLGFSNGISSPSYTNDYGEATIDHSSVGRADIYISGNKKGSFRAPGRTAVTL